MKQKRTLALLAALALALSLLAGCGDAQPSRDGAGAQSGPDDRDGVQEESQPEDPAVQPEEVEGESPAPEDGPPEEETPERTPSGEDAEPQEAGPVLEPEPEPEPEPEAEPEPEPEAEPEPEPEAEPEPKEEPEGAPACEDGSYTANVTLEGGTGRSTIESPARLRCEGGQFYAVIAWSSPNYDYMKVGGEKYLPTNTEGNSTFEIPVAAFDQPLAVIADTVAMSEPHEVEYTLTFDFASLQRQ